MDQRARLVSQILDQFESRALPQFSAIDARQLHTPRREAPLRMRRIATAIAPRGVVPSIGRSLHEARSDESGEDTNACCHPWPASRKALEIHEHPVRLGGLEIRPEILGTLSHCDITFAGTSLPSLRSCSIPD